MTHDGVGFSTRRVEVRTATLRVEKTSDAAHRDRCNHHVCALRKQLARYLQAQAMPRRPTNLSLNASCKTGRSATLIRPQIELSEVRTTERGYFAIVATVGLRICASNAKHPRVGEAGTNSGMIDRTTMIEVLRKKPSIKC